MLKAIFNWFVGGKPTEHQPAPKVAPEAAPYKVEAPVQAVVKAPEPAKCGCGRSQSGFCVGLHKLTAEEWATHKDNPNKVSAKPKRAPAKPKAEKKPVAAIKAPKKPRTKKTDK